MNTAKPLSFSGPEVEGPQADKAMQASDLRPPAEPALAAGVDLRGGHFAARAHSAELELPEISPNPILEVRGLCVDICGRERTLRAVDSISFQIPEQSTLGLVGESGSGKTLAALSILNLPPAGVRISAGQVLFRGRDVLGMSARETRALRGKEIALIFQEPMASLNPVLTVQTQLTEGMLAHLDISKKQARRQALELLEQAGISDPRRRLREYPHQLSGGMQQRVMIAIALACQPSLLIADEPTTALDVTVQAQILDLLRRLREQYRLSMLLISHDLGVVAQNADWVAVMYAGRIVEFASCRDLFGSPQHPYTQALLRAVPRLQERRDRLTAVPGTVPSLHSMPAGCSFHPRCPEVIGQCSAAVPALRQVRPTHWARCIRR